MASKTTTAQKNAWNSKHYDKVYFCVPIGAREEIAAAAADKGMSMASYIRSLIIAADGKKCPSLAGMHTPPPPPLSMFDTLSALMRYDYDPDQD